MLKASIGNPFFSTQHQTSDIPSNDYEKMLAESQQLQKTAFSSAKNASISRQHQKNRMTVWERIEALSDIPPSYLFQNWGPSLDGASIVTAIIQINGRDVAVYGHDFTIRAGSIDATNGKKLARLITMAGKQGIPLVGLNDSAGAFVPAGVGGLEGYAEAFSALRSISGIVPSIMCMFGFNAGGGSYLPRQGSFVIQPQDTFIGLTGPDVVANVLGEQINANDLGGATVHSQTGVSDLIVENEVQALNKVIDLLHFLPDNHHSLPTFFQCSDPVTRKTQDVDRLLSSTLSLPTGINTPFDVRIIIQDICDYGDYFEIQPDRAPNTVTAFTRCNGHVVGIVANNSAVASGQIDINAAYKNARFIRFCNLYNIPVIFLEDTTGFLPGKEQEHQGIVQAGRAMLDAIIDLRTPRFLVILRNGFGGAYASFNNYPTGADFVIALPTARVAVMGSSGVQYVYKQELKTIEHEKHTLYKEQLHSLIEQGMNTEIATIETENVVKDWYQQQLQKLNEQYEHQFMNAKEALSLGAISHIVEPWDLRTTLCQQLDFHLRHYKPSPLSTPQREFY